MKTPIPPTAARAWAVMALLCLASLWSAPTQAALTTQFTVQQLSDFLKGYQNSNDPRKQMLASDLQQKLAAQGVTLTESGFTISGTAPGGSNSTRCGDRLLN